MEPQFYVLRESSVRGALTSYTYTPRQHDDEAEVITDFAGVLTECRPLLLLDLLEQLNRLRSVKWHIACRIEFVKYSITSDSGVHDTISSNGVFRGRCQVTLSGDVHDTLDEQLESSYNKILESISRYTREGSGWIVDSVQRVELIVARYRPLSASSYIPTSTKLSKTKAVVNVENTADEMCFVWSVLASICPVKLNRNRVSKYRHHTHRLNMSGIPYPVSYTHLDVYKRQF